MAEDGVQLGGKRAQLSPHTVVAAPEPMARPPHLIQYHTPCIPHPIPHNPTPQPSIPHLAPHPPSHTPQPTTSVHQHLISCTYTPAPHISGPYTLASCIPTPYTFTQVVDSARLCMRLGVVGGGPLRHEELVGIVVNTLVTLLSPPGASVDLGVLALQGTLLLLSHSHTQTDTGGNPWYPHAITPLPSPILSQERPGEAQGLPRVALLG